MKKFLIILICTSFFSVTGYSKCKEPVRLLNLNDKAPCTGFLFSPDAEKQAAEDHENAKFYKELNLRLTKRKELTDKEISILDRRLELYIEQSNTLSEQLTKKESQSKFEKVLWFGLGIFVTGLSVYGASQINR